jgi:hypothetical protein
METPKTVQSSPSESRGTSTSASSAQADSLCAGRHLAQQRFPEEQSSSDSIYGTRVHDALASQKDDMLNPDQQSTYEACNAIVQKILPQFFGQDIKDALAIPTREKRFWLTWADGLKHSGQLDAIYKRATKALIVEFKTLNGEIAESSRNMQLRDQAVLLDFNVPLLSEVGVVVVQPLVTHSPEICVYKREDLLRARNELYARVNASNNPTSPRKAGEIQCKFCRARSGCPEYNAWAGREVAATPETESLIEKPVFQWSPAERTVFLDRAGVIEKWIDNCKMELKKMLKADPEAVPGYELKPGATKGTIINPQAVFDNFSKVGGTLDQFMKCVSVTKSALEVEVRTVTKAKGKKLEDAVDAIIGENVQKKQNEPSIVKK